MSTEIALSTPIQAHGETLTRLELRAPTGKDIRLCGNPFNMLGAFEGAQPDLSRVQVDDAKLAAMLSNLAAIPPSSVDQLSFADYQLCVVALFGFLAPAAPTSSTGISNAPGSGTTSTM